MPVHALPDHGPCVRESMAIPHVAFGMAIVGEFPGPQKGLGLVIATAQNNITRAARSPDVHHRDSGAYAKCLISLLEWRLLSRRPRFQSEEAAT